MKKEKNNIVSFIILIYAISIFTNMSYFVLPTYPIVFVGIIVKMIKYIAYLFVVLLLIKRKGKISITKGKLIAFFSVILGVFCFHFLPIKITSINVLDIMIITDTFILLFVFSEEEATLVFKDIVIVFLIITIPSVVYYLITYFLGIALPYNVIEPGFKGKIARGDYYEWRPLGLLYVEGISGISRPCGVFDEPGVLGTFSALLLAANYQRKPSFNIINILLLLVGIASFSLAFYILLLILMIIEAIKKGMVKLCFAIAILAFMLLAFVNMNTENASIIRLQKRVSSEDKEGIVISNNRYGNEYEEAFNKFLSEGGYALAFGNGQGSKDDNSAMYGSSVYMDLIYDFGVIGTILYLLVFIILVFCFGINKMNIPFLLVFLASIYQRPYVLNRQYIVVYISALCFLNFYKGLKNDG